MVDFVTSGYALRDGAKCMAFNVSMIINVLIFFALPLGLIGGSVFASVMSAQSCSNASSGSN